MTTIQEDHLPGDRRPHERQGTMRIGRWDVRPFGGALGCLGMIVISVVASILLTILLNVCVQAGR